MPPVFPKEELERRLEAVRATLQSAQLDAAVIGVPENIYYPTGLDHWGFFACHLLIVPAEGEMVLTCRKMERITVENQVTSARFYGARRPRGVKPPTPSVIRSYSPPCAFTVPDER